MGSLDGWRLIDGCTCRAEAEAKEAWGANHEPDCEMLGNWVQVVPVENTKAYLMAKHEALEIAWKLRMVEINREPSSG